MVRIVHSRSGEDLNTGHRKSSSNVIAETVRQARTVTREVFSKRVKGVIAKATAEEVSDSIRKEHPKGPKP